MTRSWLPGALGTLIGSMPHRDPQRVIDLIVQAMGDIPVWPQLPAYEGERMMVQYLEGLPGLRAHGDHILVDTEQAQFDSELVAFYQDFMDVEAGLLDIRESRFQMGKRTGGTFRKFVQRLEQTPRAGRAVKGQIVGPFTLLTGLTDAQRKPLLYDDRLCDVVPKHLGLKARWQIEHLRSLGQPVIVFLDEPSMAGYGSSAYIGASAELISTILGEVIRSIHQAGALAGIHVCANTEWSLVLSSSADVVNFDAYGYLDRFLLYHEDIAAFLRTGGIIAWGLVPTSDPEAIMRETAQTLAERWSRQIQPLIGTEFSMTQILAQSIITPSCGCGSLTEELAERVVRLTEELSELLRCQVGAGAGGQRGCDESKTNRS
ncbi:MAG TPA: hypothetical protein DCE18_06725 [Syntrophobacteraceae bacterium]|nr:hypothetical protein [Syntrophobacteraceae bacterium]